MSGEDKAFKLVDLKNFTVYSDSELFGELEGQALVVSGQLYVLGVWSNS